MYCSIFTSALPKLLKFLDGFSPSVSCPKVYDRNIGISVHRVSNHVDQFHVQKLDVVNTSGWKLPKIPISIIFLGLSSPSEWVEITRTRIFSIFHIPATESTWLRHVLRNFVAQCNEPTSIMKIYYVLLILAQFIAIKFISCSYF